MPPKFDILQAQTNRKNCIKQLVDRIDQLSRIVQQKDQRILQLENFIGQMWTVARGEGEASNEQPSEGYIVDPRHQRLQSISFKQDQRMKFAIRSRSSSAEASAPYSEEQLEAIHCLQAAGTGQYSDTNSEHQQSSEVLASKPHAEQANTLATTRATHQ